jgi:hypothetical protein
MGFLNYYGLEKDFKVKIYLFSDLSFACLF